MNDEIEIVLSDDSIEVLAGGGSTLVRQDGIIYTIRLEKYTGEIMDGKPGAREHDVVRAGGADPFDWVQPSKDQGDNLIEWRGDCKALRDCLLRYVGEPNRERSLAITQLEIVLMWGSKAILAGPK